MIKFSLGFCKSLRKEFVKKHTHIIKEIVDNESGTHACQKLLSNLARMELGYTKQVSDKEILTEVVGVYIEMGLKGKWKKNLG